MRKQILTAGLAILVASSSVYAFGGGFERGSNCGDKMMNKSFMKSQNSGMYQIISIVSDMDLSKEQWIEIKKTMHDMKKERFDDKQERPTITFNKDGSFDKEKFIKDRSSFSKEMIESQATVVEKITSILDKSQKKILFSN